MKKYLTLAAVSIALLFQACGDDSFNSSSPIECMDEECLDEPSSSSSKKEDIKSSSSSKKEEAKSSSSSVKDKDKSSSSSKEEIKSSSSSKEIESSSSEEPKSSSSVEYASSTPNLADLEVSGDTLFAIFQRYVYDEATYSTSFNEKGLLAMYNVKDGTLLDTIQLATKNPVAVKMVKGSVYVATQGEYNASWGTDADDSRGIEKVDLKNKKSTLFVGGSKLGGGIQSFDVDEKKNMAYATINEYYGSVPAVEIDLSSGSVKKIDGVVDGSGTLAVDPKNGLVYIGHRYIDYNTFDMNINVMVYDGSKISYLSDAEENDVRMPYSIATIEGTPYVFVSDYNTGALYFNYEDSDDEGLSFDQDSKLAIADGVLYVMSRSGTGSVSRIDVTAQKVKWQKGAENGNPYDVVSAGNNEIWVAMFGSAEIRKLSAANGETIGSIDTKIFCAKK